MRKEIIPIIIVLISIGFVLSQETLDVIEITPKTIGWTEVCFSYTLEDVVSKASATKTMCREYPSDLTNKCREGRYGRQIDCKNRLIDVINEDIDKWYKQRLPTQIDASKKLKDVTVISAGSDASSLVDKKFDFISGGFK